MNKLKIRSVQESDTTITYLDGYASVYGQRSRKIMEGNNSFYEIIERGAFDEVLQSDNLNTKGVVDHDKTKLLGRTRAKTLTLLSDETGLKYSIRMGTTQLHKDTLEMVERGDLTDSSFKFALSDEDMTVSRDGDDLIVTVHKVRRLEDISLVTDGAYDTGTVKVRALVDKFEADEIETARVKKEADELVELERSITEANQAMRIYVDTLKESIK